MIKGCGVKNARGVKPQLIRTWNGSELTVSIVAVTVRIYGQCNISTSLYVLWEYSLKKEPLFLLWHSFGLLCSIATMTVYLGAKNKKKSTSANACGPIGDSCWSEAPPVFHFPFSEWHCPISLSPLWTRRRWPSVMSKLLNFSLGLLFLVL